LRGCNRAAIYAGLVLDCSGMIFPFLASAV